MPVAARTVEIVQNERKRKWERSTLELVYDPVAFEIVHDDSPDFRLSRPGKAPFGVEVTDVFIDDSQARMLFVEGYMESLWKGGRHIHRDDVVNLEVAELEVTDPTGEREPRKIQGIVRTNPTRDDHYERIAEVLERKNAAFRLYERELGHTNLVIADHFPTTSGIEKEFRSADILLPRLREALRTSPFRSVKLISHVGYEDSVYYELDLMWLWEGFMVYLEAILNTYGAPHEVEEQDVAVLYSEATRQRGWPVALSWDSGRPFAAGGDFGIALVEDSGIVIHDYDDWSRPHMPVIPRYSASADTVARVNRRFHSMLTSSTLVASHSMPVRRNEKDRAKSA